MIYLVKAFEALCVFVLIFGGCAALAILADEIAHHREKQK